jgi:hypothetical protein
VLLVVGDLDLAAAIGLRERGAHRGGLPVGVHDHPAVGVARRAADRLDERGLAAQEALLVGVEDRHEGDLGQVEALAQQVDADEDVVLAQAQVADDLDALERVDLRVQVADLEAHLEQVVREVLGHLLGQRRDEDALLAVDDLADLVHQVVDLVARLAHLDVGSTMPVGRTICSTILPEWLRSKSPGVAETNRICGVIERNSSNVCGRLSIALGSRKP